MFAAIQKQVQEALFQQYVASLKPAMTRSEFMVAYLRAFVTDEVLPPEGGTSSDDMVNAVQSTSLLPAEEAFLVAMIRLLVDDADKGWEDVLGLVDDELRSCQLGPRLEQSVVYGRDNVQLMEG